MEVLIEFDVYIFRFMHLYDLMYFINLNDLAQSNMIGA